jgi:hypothetical protein
MPKVRRLSHNYGQTGSPARALAMGRQRWRRAVGCRPNQAFSAHFWRLAPLLDTMCSSATVGPELESSR